MQKRRQLELPKGEILKHEQAQLITLLVTRTLYQWLTCKTLSAKLTAEH